MEKAFIFLAKHKDVAFATIEGDRPKIRVFQIMKRENNTLYFATAPHKEVYRQLQLCPFVELLAMAGNISVRVKGKAVFDVSDKTRKEIYETNPILMRLYHSYSDLVYFRLNISELDFYDLTPTPPIFNHYNFPLIVGILTAQSFCG